MTVPADSGFTPFHPSSFDSNQPFTVLGTGSIGGKAEGLSLLRSRVLPELDPSAFPGIEVDVPNLVVLTADLYDRFVTENDLLSKATSGASDREIAAAFQEAVFSAGDEADLRALGEGLVTPLAIRSSRTLEKEILRPGLGIYSTKLIPNNEKKPEDRFHHLCQAIKLVYASTFFSRARAHVARSGRLPGAQRMAVIVQELVGSARGHRFYPTVSGAASSYNYYPVSGSSPTDGVVSLALGLGKTIVEGGRCWVYCPVEPDRPPPFLGTKGLLKRSQVRFWAVDMRKQVHADPTREEEFLARCSLEDAMEDGSLRLLASSYDAEFDRLAPGAGGRGPKILNYAPLLGSRELPVNDLIRHVLELTDEAFGTSVEIEFALDLDSEGRSPARLGIVQARTTDVSSERIEVEESRFGGADVVLACRSAMGNGSVEGIRDVVFVKPKDLDPVHTRLMATEVARFDQALRAAQRPYLLIGVGRWGTQDPWLGIPVTWDQISGARVIVETTLPQLNPEPSQGAHFFQSMVAGGVLYLSTRHEEQPGIDWEWLDRQEVVDEGQYIKHVRSAQPLSIAVDGRTGRGIVTRGG